LEEFKHVEPALSAFVLCYETLRSSELLSNLLLGETSLHASGYQQLSELDVLGEWIDLLLRPRIGR
jgi:hypothetical protein